VFVPQLLNFIHDNDNYIWELDKVMKMFMMCIDHLQRSSHTQAEKEMPTIWLIASLSAVRPQMREMFPWAAEIYG